MSRAFDHWLRENAPPTGDDVAAERRLRGRIIDRLHERRQRRLTRGAGLAAVAVVVLVVGLVDIRPLGSDNWKVVPVDGREGRFEVPLTGEKWTVGRDAVDGVTTQDYFEQVREQKAAGAYALTAVEFWDLGGHFLWSVTTRHEIGGKPVESTQSPDRANTMSRDDGIWLRPHAVSLAEDMAAGVWREAPSRHYRVNGRDYWFRVWAKPTTRGVLHYGSAVIPEDLE